MSRPASRLPSKSTFKRVILYARQHRANQDVIETLMRLIDFLQAKNIEVFQDKDTEVSFNLPLTVIERDAINKSTDLIVVVGGDGSLLSAARMAILVDTPVIGINRGRLGFLTDISPQNIENDLSAILAGEYVEEKRFLINTRIQNEGNITYQANALNDVVLSRGMETHLIEFDVLIDNQFVSHYRSDGLILSTPTGSTAYSLSAGGPIMHPQLDAIILVPMFSHSLNSRPLVFAGESTIEIKITGNTENELQISCDGHESGKVYNGQNIFIQKNKQQLRLLHPIGYHYYDTLRIKLGWGNKP
jgi:NAD+ kinase